MAKKVVNQKIKAVKALHKLSIGEILICFGLLAELSFLTEWMYIAALATIVGLIITLIGVIKLRKINKYFLVSFFAVLLTLIVGITLGLFNYFYSTNEIFQKWIKLIQDLSSKGISVLYTFGILHGCALAATGKSKSKFGFHMMIVNSGGKGIAFVLNLIATLISKTYPVAAGILAIIATVISIIVELYFCVFLFRTHKKAKKQVENLALN